MLIQINIGQERVQTGRAKYNIVCVQDSTIACYTY